VRKLKEDRENSVMRGAILFSSPGVFMVIKSRRMRLAGLVACIEKKRNTYRI
jgi:hypothetical protein